MSEGSADELSQRLRNYAADWLTQPSQEELSQEEDAAATRAWLLHQLGVESSEPSDDEEPDLTADKENVGPHNHEVLQLINGEWKTVQCSDPACPLWVAWLANRVGSRLTASVSRPLEESESA